MIWVGQLILIGNLFVLTRNHWTRKVLYAPFFVGLLLMTIFEIWHVVKRRQQKTQRETWTHISKLRTQQDVRTLLDLIR
jgi:TRAP-type C4-dicarboxylate transport system permease small subunit